MDRRSLLAYTAIVGTCVAGAMHASWSAVLVGGSCLALNLLIAPRKRVAYATTVGVTEPVVVVASLVNASAIASGAYIFGYLARWAWGV